MNKYISNKNFIVLFLLVLFIIGWSKPVVAELSFTEEEINYIENRKPIIAASLDGGAPLHYRDSKGKIVGIAVSTLDTISEMTGLIFEYRLYECINDAFESDSDIIFGLTPQYAPENIILSNSYLQSKTILFINASLDINNLEGEIFASISGGVLPEGVNERNAIYYNSREETLDAVEHGKAGYGYGNEYSIAFYTIQNGYENIITVPRIKESREYSIGVPKEDSILLSIINKSIDAIDDEQMNQIILKTASSIERKISFFMVVDEYGDIIYSIFSIVIFILLLLLASNIRAKKALDLQNKRYMQLSHISNECIFEYDIKSNKINFSDKCEALFGTKENLMEMHKPLKKIILSDISDDSIEILNLKLLSGEKGIFKTIKSDIYGDNGKKYYTIGKLIDISADMAEKENLITKAQTDGLTNLYNSITTKKLINDSIRTRSINTSDALILFDCDKFKDINDSLGHLEGDRALQNVSKLLKNNFREKDIIGRIGGDEFCVYMKDIPSESSVIIKCQNLISYTKEMYKSPDFTFSIGVAFLKDEETYEQLFKKADLALYKAKDNGGAKVVCFSEDLLP